MIEDTQQLPIFEKINDFDSDYGDIDIDYNNFDLEKLEREVMALENHVPKTEKNIRTLNEMQEDADAL